MRLVEKFLKGKKANYKTNGPLNRPELKRRLAFLESRFKTDAARSNGATGLFLIMPIALEEFNRRHKNGRLYTMDDMLDAAKNTDVRNWLLDNAEYSKIVDRNNRGDSVAYALAMAGYDWGLGNVLGALEKAENLGLDTRDSWEMFDHKYHIFPQETIDYINFGLKGLDVNTSKTKATNSEYQKALKNNKVTVGIINNTKYRK